MYNSNIPPSEELPSTGRLIKSTILAVVIASVLLITVVLPAEYGIDPTGIGGVLGLQKMGEIKVSLAAEAAQATREEAAAEKNPAKNPAVKLTAQPKKTTQPEENTRNHERKFTLAPNQGKEFKLKMAKGKEANYTWWSSGGRVNFDVHADSKKLKIKYHNYSKGSEKRKQGSIKAAFDGYHGWFWRNRTTKNLVVTLQTKGDYQELIQVK